MILRTAMHWPAHDMNSQMTPPILPSPGIILWMRPATERQRYIVTSPVIGWVHIQNDPCLTGKLWGGVSIVSILDKIDYVITSNYLSMLTMLAKEDGGTSADAMITKFRFIMPQCLGDNELKWCIKQRVKAGPRGLFALYLLMETIPQTIPY